MKKYYYVILFIITIYVPSIMTYAEEMTSDFDVNLTFQDDKKLEGYLDVDIENDKLYKINVYIQNKSKVEKKFVVTAVNAFTNSNGTIEYSTTNNTYNKVVLNDLITTPSKVSVKGNSNISIPLTFKTPTNLQKGVIMGGIETRLDTQESNDKSVSLNQKLVMLNIIKLNTTREKIIPELLIKDVNQVDNHLNIQIENPDAVTFGQLNFQYQLEDPNTNKKLLSGSIENLEMAPNSSYTLIIDLPFSNRNLLSGEKKLKIIGSSGNKTWELNEVVDLKKLKIKDLNQYQQDFTSSEAKNFVYIIILFLVILILLLIIILVYIYRYRINRNQKKHKKKKSIRGKKAKSKK